MVENVAVSMLEIQEKRVQTTQKLCSIPVMIDSISPILTRHEFQRTVQYLKVILSSSGCDGTSPTPFRMLEDFAFAAICLHQGEASLLCRVVQDEGSELRKEVLVLVESSSPQLHLDGIHDEEVAQTSAKAIATNAGAHGIAARRTKVQLKLEPDVPSKTKHLPHLEELWQPPMDTRVLLFFLQKMTRSSMTMTKKIQTKI
jgi:hypothetical protein